MSTVILLSGQGPSNQFMSRYAGPHRLATELRKKGFDTQVIMGLGYYPVDDLLKLIESYIDDNTLILGISTTFFIEYSQRYAIFPSRLYFGERWASDIVEVIKQIKTNYPKIKIVVGGPAPKAKLRSLEHIDLIIEGYGDNAFTDYCESVRKKSHVFFASYHHNVPFQSDPYGKNFDFRHSSIVFDGSDQIFQNEALPLELARGCIFKCKFCSYPMRGKNINDNSFLKHEDVLYNELMHNYEKFQTTNYIFVDDTFNDNQDKLKTLHSTFKKLPFKINFAAYIRADLLGVFPESIELLKDMGIRGAFFGIESMNLSAKKAAAKGINNDRLFKTLEEVNRVWDDVAITSSFICGLPNDDLKSITEWSNDLVFNNPLFDKHDLIFQPLYLQKSKTAYNSDFDLEMDKYGYRFTDNGNVWENDSTTFKEMFNLAKEYNLKSALKPRSFGGFNTVTLLGYGFDINTALNLDSHNETDINKVEDITIERYQRYYTQMLNASPKHR